MKYIKKTVLSVSVIIALIITACSIRDYSNPLLNDQFNGPQIFVQSPTNGDLISGSVDLLGYATDISHVSRVEVTTENGTILLTNNSVSQTLNFNINLPFYSIGSKTITIQAFDRFNISTTLNLVVDVDIVSPFLYLSTPSDYFSYTNVLSMVFAGTSTIAQGLVSQITMERLNDGTSFSVAGLNNWSTTVDMLADTTNTFRVTAISDRGVERSEERQVVMDTIAPDVTFISPVNGQDVPRDLMVEMLSSDSMSPIWGTMYRVDTGNYDTNTFNSTSYTFYPNLTNGPHILYAQTRDLAGNTSTLNSITVNVDDTIPAIFLNEYWYITNATTMVMKGFSSVGTGNSILDIAISVNGSPYVSVSMFTLGVDYTQWTNSATTLSANIDNTVSVRAVSSAFKTNYVSRHFFVDTIPPVFNQLNPLNGSTVVNTNQFNYILDVSDAETGIASISFNIIVGGVTNFTNYNIFSDSPPSFSDSGYSDPVPGGGEVTNIITVYDAANNSVVRTNVVSVYPAIFVGTSGNNANAGFMHQTLENIDNAITTARSLGVTNVVVLSGTYFPNLGLNGTGTGINISGDDIHIYGGFEVGTGNFTGQTILDGNGVLTHIIKVQNANNIDLNNLVLLEAVGGSAPDNLGAGLYLDNVVNSRLTALRITNNSLGGVNAKGTGIYGLNSHNNNIQVLVANNGGAEQGAGIYWIGDNNIFEMQNEGNSASGNGGGFFLQGKDNTIKGIISNNLAVKNGGGLFLQNTVNTTIEAQINQNISSNGGGIFILNGDRDSFLPNANISYNKATNGGGIFLDNGVDQIIDATIQNNQSRNGAGLYLSSVQDLQLNGLFQYNFAANLGGAVYAFKGDLNTINAKIVSNQALNGGGILVEAGQNYTFSTLADIQYNYAYGNLADGNGGGVALYGGNNITLDTSLMGNVAMSRGGGLFLYGSSNISVNNNIQDNVAVNNNGGGIYISPNSFIVTLQGLYSNNSSTNGSGGAISISNANNINLTAQIWNNYTGLNGGAVSLELASNISIQASIINNLAQQRGGAFYINNSKSVTVSSSIISNNTSLAIKSIIHFGPGTNIELLDFHQNTIFGTDSANDTVFFEQAYDVTNHTIMNNIFVTNKLKNLYFDAGAGSFISRDRVDLLNVLTNLHDATSVGGNTVQ